LAQRGKAGAFLDFLGLEGHQNIPATIIASVNESRRVKELLDEEVNLLQDCNAASQERRFPIR
jgi:hypothetical protein